MVSGAEPVVVDLHAVRGASGAVRGAQVLDECGGGLVGDRDLIRVDCYAVPLHGHHEYHPPLRRGRPCDEGESTRPPRAAQHQAAPVPRVGLAFGLRIAQIRFIRDLSVLGFRQLESRKIVRSPAKTPHVPSLPRFLLRIWWRKNIINFGRIGKTPTRRHGIVKKVKALACGFLAAGGPARLADEKFPMSTRPIRGWALGR